MCKFFIIVLCCIVALIAGGWYFYINVGQWLSRSDNITRTDVIICLSSLSSVEERIDKAVLLHHQGYGDKILVTTWLTLSSILKRDMDRRNILQTGRTAHSTYEEAMYAAQFLSQMPYSSVTVISDPYHMLRVRWSFDRLLPAKIKRVYVSTTPNGSDGFWWDNKESRRYVLREVPKLIYYWIFHGVLGIHDEPDWAKKLQSWYDTMVPKFA
jgi:uncharacterized SAM-binding protein YcdF (DUF218 family)